MLHEEASAGCSNMSANIFSLTTQEGEAEAEAAVGAEG